MFDSLPNFPRHRRWRKQLFPGPIVVALIRRPPNASSTAVSPPHYLLIQRKSGAYYNGQWALVGGKWDFGETLMTAVTREVKEETNLDADFIALRGIVSERLAPSNQKNDGTMSHRGDAAHFLIFVCELAAANGTASEQNEGAVAWFSRAEIDDLHAQNAIIPSDYLMLQQFAGSTESIPHFEAEMVSALGDKKKRPSQLMRFERIDGPETS